MDGSAPKPGARRRALLLGVARHANHQGWDLPYVEEDLRLLTKALNDLPGGFEVEVKKNQQVTVETVRNFLTAELPRQLEGDGHLLLIYFSGHGAIQDGDRSYFTHFTDLAGDRYTGLISEKRDLMKWVADLKTKVGIRVVFLVDACAPTEKAPAGRPAELELGDAAFYATPRGELASLSLDRHASAFTQELAATLTDLGQKTRLTLECVRNRLQERYKTGVYTAASGRSLEGLVLYDLENLCIEIKALDGITQEALPGARVTEGGRDRGATPCRLQGFAQGSYRFTLAREGFLRRHVEVELDPATSGGTYTVPLYPRYLVLQGRVPDAGPETEVEVLGGRGQFREGYHLWRTQLAGDGSFRLYLPLDATPSGVRLRRQGQPLAVREFALSELAPVDHVIQGNRTPIHDLGAFRLADAAPSAAQEIYDLTGEARLYFEEGEKFAAAGPDHLEDALALFKLAFEQVGTREIQRRLGHRVRALYEQWLRHLASERRQDYALGAKVAREALAWEPDNASFSEWKERCERENIPLQARRMLAQAAHHLETGRLDEAEKTYAALTPGGGLTPFYLKLVERNLGEIRDQLFRESFCLVANGKRQDRPAEVRSAFLECRRLRPDHPMVKLWDRWLATSLDEEPPELAIHTPMEDRIAVGVPEIRIEGEATDNQRVAALLVNGEPVTLTGEEEGRKGFNVLVNLQIGMNRIRVTAEDARGWRTEKSIFVEYIQVPQVSGFVFQRVQSFSAGGQTHEVMIYRHDQTGLEFVLVPDGTFLMGSPEDEKGRDGDEGPQFSVSVKAFLICRTEVPNKVFRMFKPDHDSGSFNGLNLNGDLQPAAGMSWEQADSWCRQLDLRLPSEAEWEYACRAGTRFSRFWGENEQETPKYANVPDRSARMFTTWSIMNVDDGHTGSAPVGSYQPNAFGLFDMLGNVWELCADRYHDSYRGAPDDGRAWLKGGSDRVYRGGSWRGGAHWCRSAQRGDRPRDLANSIGFRPAKSLP